MPEQPEWKPGSCVAPAVVLLGWITDNGLLVPLLAVAPGDRPGHAAADESARLIAEILDRRPLTERHAGVLGSATHVPAGFWLALEHNYRACLAAGLPDAEVTGI